MKRMPLWPVLAVLVWFAGTVSYADNHAKPMTDDDVVAMVKAGLPDDTIISAINSQATDFDVSAQALVSLKNQGVSVKVIDAMLASLKRHGAADHPPSQPSPGPDAAGTPPQGEQFAPANSSSQPAANPPGNGQTSTASGSAAQTSAGPRPGFFDRVNQAQSQVTGAIQQGQSSYQQVRAGMPGRQNPNATAQPGQAPGAWPAAPNANAGNEAQPGAANQPAAPANPAVNPSAPNSTQPVTNQAAAQQRYQAQQRALMTQQNSAQLQQQRQQQAAAAQQRRARYAACRDQAAKAYPKGGPDFAKSYTSCIQAINK